MSYYSHLDEKWMALREWLDLKREHGAAADTLSREVERELERLTALVQKAEPDAELLRREPDDLEAIRALRPDGPRKLDPLPDAEDLEDRILGAWLGRGAGCTLGVPVEGFSREEIRAAAAALDQPYPLEDYWTRLPKPTLYHSTYNGLPYRRFLRDEMIFLMPDDDLLYTLLGLLILEEYGPGFTPEDVGRAWLRYVPFACTAEKHALDNLRRGMKPPETAYVNNPDGEYLGADIRADPWGYACAGLPELAAEMAWRDARISHTRNGIYGAMYYAALIASVLATGDIRESIRVALTEIPAECRLAIALRETLGWCSELRDLDSVLDRIFAAHKGMHIGHTINNAALVTAVLELESPSFERIITRAVMAGMDTDCNGATAGSIAGAAWGASRLPERWIFPLGSIHRSYLNGLDVWDSRDIATRFVRAALRIRREALNGNSKGPQDPEGKENTSTR
jgi:ADP-ribosylglycohydrolase